MAQSSRYYYIDSDVMLEFIYHDQSEADKYKIEVDDNGSEVKFLNTVDNNPFETRHLINELGSAVVNFEVTSVSGYLAVENFAARTLLLQNGKTYKFDLSELDSPSLFTISGTNGIFNYSSTTDIASFTPNQNGIIEYTYDGLIGGKIIIDTRANPLFADPDETTGNDINQIIGRYHGISVDTEDNTKHALLGYDSTGYYETFNYINNNLAWKGGNENDLIQSQSDATANINYIKYDTVRLHLRSGFSFAARNYEGFLFEITTERNSGIKNYLTQLVYLNTSNYEYSNPKPFMLGEKLYTKFIDIKVPTLIEQNTEFLDRFYGDGSAGSSDLNPSSNYGINFKLIDRLEAIGGYDYFYTGEENSFTVSREDEFQDFTVVIEDAEDGDYFKIYGEKDNSIGAFEAYILNRISTSSDDIMVMYDVDIYEFIRTSEIKTFSTTYTQYESFNDPIVFRPVIMNSNIAANFSIEVTMRIYNQTDNTQIVKRASLTLEQTGRYGKKLNKLKIDSPNQLTEVYNVLPQLAANKLISGFITDSLPRSVKYVPAFIERHNIIASKAIVSLIGTGENDGIKDVEETETGEFKGENETEILIPRTNSYYKFVIAKKKSDDFEYISFDNAERMVLVFNDGKTDLKFNNIYNKDIDMGSGEILFKITKSNAIKISGMNTDKFYINLYNGQEETMVISGKFKIT
jgi:hypothetical protein